MRVIVTLCLVFVGLATINEAMAAKQNSYLIKSHSVTSPSEALTILIRFMPAKLRPEERCEKYAVMLNSITRSHLDQFKLAEIGLESTEVTRQQFRSIDVETLRQLYMDGINTFRSNHIDTAMLDLVDCLSKKFRTLDAKARSFLNNQDLQEIIGQYNSVMKQPLEFLVNPSARHPDLSHDQLKPSVKQTVLDLFNQDVTMVNSRFQGHSSSPQQEEPIVEAASESLASVHQQEVPSHEEPQAPLDEVLSSEELELLHKIIGSLHEVYNKLPVNAKLGDRCQSYAKVIQADQEQLNHQLLDSIVQETANRIATSGPSNEIFRPDENVRENFLFTLSTFPKEDVGRETWIDLVDCVSEWVDEDPRVRDFLESPEQAQVLDQLMKAPDASQVAPVSAAVAQTGTVKRV